MPDAYVVHELNEPLALASAICKAGHRTRRSSRSPARAGSAVLRVRELLDGAAVRSREVELAARATLVVLTLAAVALVSSAPTWAKPARRARRAPGLAQLQPPPLTAWRRLSASHLAPNGHRTEERSDAGTKNGSAEPRLRFESLGVG